MHVKSKFGSTGFPSSVSFEKGLEAGWVEICPVPVPYRLKDTIVKEIIISEDESMAEVVFDEEKFDVDCIIKIRLRELKLPLDIIGLRFSALSHRHSGMCWSACSSMATGNITGLQCYGNGDMRFFTTKFYVDGCTVEHLEYSQETGWEVVYYDNDDENRQSIKINLS